MINDVVGDGAGKGRRVGSTGCLQIPHRDGHYDLGLGGVRRRSWAVGRAMVIKGFIGRLLGVVAVAGGIYVILAVAFPESCPYAQWLQIGGIT